ncbi:hypothetical protein BY458DRAFT_500122 [Sporodiniella umbellata]|nr:hypothetical protein BY458DRAFT_500122 [Sporodiniella umbellata]
MCLCIDRSLYKLLKQKTPKTHINVCLLSVEQIWILPTLYPEKLVIKIQHIKDIKGDKEVRYL